MRGFDEMNTECRSTGTDRRRSRVVSRHRLVQRWSTSAKQDFCYFFLPAAALLITAVALRVSASFSNPKIAEYLLPTACATMKLMLISASETAFAIICATPGL